MNKIVLAFLAAIVPIVGSLYVAVSFLGDQARLAHEYRVRHRIAALANEHYRKVRDEVDSGKRRGGLNVPGDELERFTLMLLRANGLPESRGSYTESDIRLAMSSSVESRAELRRQWVLLLSSALGLVLLAADAAR